MNGATRGYWVDAPGRGSLRPTPLAPPAATTTASTAGATIELRALCTGVSPGTERLVGTGRVPVACDTTMAVPGMQGSFALPILYGYSFVGAAADGRRAFTMHPHCERALVAAARCVWLPDDVPAARATLFANLETAQNAVWDAEPAAGERVVVIGAGAVGALVAFVLAASHAGEVVVVEADAERRARAAALPWVRTALAPDELPRGAFALALHASGTGAGLQLAIDAVGFEGRVLDLSWYGDQAVALRLGDTFHVQRKSLRASQVGTVAPRHRAAGAAARTEVVRRWLGDARLDALLGEPIAFAALPAWFGALYRGERTEPCPVVQYGA